MSEINQMDDVRSIIIDGDEHDCVRCYPEVDGSFFLDQKKSLEMGYKCYSPGSIMIDMCVVAFNPLPVTEGRTYSLSAKVRGRILRGDFECRRSERMSNRYGNGLYRHWFHRDGKMEQVIL